MPVGQLSGRFVQRLRHSNRREEHGDSEGYPSDVSMLCVWDEATGIGRGRSTGQGTYLLRPPHEGNSQGVGEGTPPAIEAAASCERRRHSMEARTRTGALVLAAMPAASACPAVVQRWERFSGCADWPAP